MWCWRCWMPGTRRAVAARSWKRPCAELGAGSAWCWCSIRSVRRGGGGRGGSRTPVWRGAVLSPPAPSPRPGAAGRGGRVAEVPPCRVPHRGLQGVDAAAEPQPGGEPPSVGGGWGCHPVSFNVTLCHPAVSLRHLAVTWCCPLVTHSPFVACSSVTWHLMATQCHPAVSRCHPLSPSSVPLSPSSVPLSPTLPLLLGVCLSPSVVTWCHLVAPCSLAA